MELEKPHNLPFASWRPRKAGGVRYGKEGSGWGWGGWTEARTSDVSLSESESLRTKSITVPGQEKRRWMSQLK